MKNPLIPLALAALLATPAFAQDKGATLVNAAELRAKIQSDKKGIVERNMGLTPDEAKKFWPIYDQYQKDLAAPQSTYNRAVLDYVNSEKSITDANAKRIVGDIQGAQEAEAKLRKSTFEKLEKAIGAKKAARYLQLENKMDAVLKYEAAAAIPLVH